MESKANVRRGAKDLQLFERKRIEQMHNAGHSAEEIAVEIGVCYVTIYRELKRGDTGEMDELGRRVYDAELAQRKAALAGGTRVPRIRRTTGGADGVARTQAARRARIPGNRYETCIGCGLDWNVSLFAPKGWYICPQCEYRIRKERRYEQAQAQGFERDHRPA